MAKLQKNVLRLIEIRIIDFKTREELVITTSVPRAWSLKQAAEFIRQCTHSMDQIRTVGEAFTNFLKETQNFLRGI